MRDRSGKILLIDLDASVSFSKRQHAGAKYSSAYIPPEMIILDLNDNELKVRSESDGIPIKDLLVATPQFDMWSLGVVMYQLCTNEPLFLSNSNDNVDEIRLKLLHEIPDAWKQSKMNKITDIKARNLISKLLSKDPMKRPLTSAVLNHPFLSGKSGQKSAYDVYLSYRDSCDATNAERIYNLLTKKGLKVWWDKKRLTDNIDWEEGFCDGLVNSRSFVCIISESAISNSFKLLTESSPCDNMLLEYQLALELRNIGFIEYIHPVFIGNKSDKNEDFFDKFQFECLKNFPKVKVNTVVDKLSSHFDHRALGSPNNPTITVNEVITLIKANEDSFVEENGIKSFNNVSESISNMLLQSKESDLLIDNNIIEKVEEEIENIDSLEYKKLKEILFKHKSENKLLKEKLNDILIEKNGIQKTKK